MTEPERNSESDLPRPEPGTPRPIPPTPSLDLSEVLETAVRAGLELAEIGISAAAQVLKLVLARLTRP
ncbi:MAG: hypothetical protein ACRDKL_07215 [Solirubrobacteraceae bacterium]